MKVIQTEVFDADGNLLKIEVQEADSGKHVVDIMWDEREEQNQDTRAEFRKWASRIIRSKNLESVN